MKTRFLPSSLILLFVCIIFNARLPFALYALPSMENNPSILNSLKLRGLAKFGERWDLSLYDSETGNFFWLGLDEERYGVKIVKVDELAMTVTVQAEDNVHVLALEESTGRVDTPNFLTKKNYTSVHKEVHLSKYNKKLLESYPLLIKETVSQETGRKLRDNSAQTELKTYLETNPSTEDLSNYLQQNGSKIDWEEFSKIKFEGVPGRKLKSKRTNRTVGRL